MDKLQKTAIVIGATGLVGSNLVQLLLKDDDYARVDIFVRRTTGIKHPKLQEHIVDFDNATKWKDKVKGDVLFSAMGTTLARAGNKTNQYKVDYTYQYDTAAAATINGVKDYILVSAANAKTNSMFFYSRMKAELEEAIIKLPFENITIIQPGLLCGERKNDKRTGETLGIKTMNFFNKIGLFKKMKPIHGKEVAQAMLQAYQTADGIEYHKGYELFGLSRSYKG